MKEQYQKEVSQIHVPNELLEKTKRAMKEEEERLKQAESRRKVLPFPVLLSVAAAAVFLIIAYPAALTGNDSGENSKMPLQMAEQEQMSITKIEADQTSQDDSEEEKEEMTVFNKAEKFIKELAEAIKEHLQ